MRCKTGYLGKLTREKRWIRENIGSRFVWDTLAMEEGKQNSLCDHRIMYEATLGRYTVDSIESVCFVLIINIFNIMRE